ncbi:MAG: undecaprenyl-diphosphate phosphatase [Tepidisphaera sp.]
MTWWHALILGLVEGITEFLPISSTGHLILTSALLGLDKPEVKDAVDDFNIIIQGGAILAVVGLYWSRIVQMARGLLGKDPHGAALFFNLVLAFLPAAVLGFLLSKAIKNALFHPKPVVAALFVGGLFMMWIDAWRKGRFGLRRHRELEITDLSPRQALLIGCFQCVAMWPGTSRSMMTIAGGCLTGLRPAAAAEFSFLLGLPTLGAACAYDLYKNLSQAKKSGGPNVFEALGTGNAIIGIVVAAISAAIAVRWLVGFLNRRGLTPFGWYRIALSLVLGVLIWRGVLTIAPP